MDRELLITGIGGQGVQLAAQVLARAALAEGREVQVFGSYGGMMRGGNTDATVVMADGPIEAPPTVTDAWSAVIMHPDYAAPTIARLRADAVVLVNATVCTEPLGVTGLVLAIPATDLAADTGSIMTASLVMLGAYAAVTGIVALDSLCEAVAAALPPYRSQHLELNRRALHLGFASTTPGLVTAWGTMAGTT